MNSVLKVLCEKTKTNYCEGHTKLKSETKFRKILHCAIKMTALNVYLPPLLSCYTTNDNYLIILTMTYYVFVKTKTTTRIFHTFFARISNNNNNATIYNENTKTRNHQTTNFSLLSKTLLYSLNKKQNKKIKTHNLIFLWWIIWWTKY